MNHRDLDFIMFPILPILMVFTLTSQAQQEAEKDNVGVITAQPSGEVCPSGSCASSPHCRTSSSKKGAGR